MRKFTGQKNKPQHRHSRFVQAGEVKMQMDIWQKPKAVLSETLQEKCHAQRPAQPFCASLRNRNAHGDGTSQNNCAQEFAGKMSRPKTRKTVWCEPAQSKWTYHKSLFAQTLCDLRARDAHGHRTRAILCENCREKCQKPDGAPWASTGLNSYRKNPLVWTRCLGKKQHKIPV